MLPHSRFYRMSPGDFLQPLRSRVVLLAMQTAAANTLAPDGNTLAPNGNLAASTGTNPYLTPRPGQITPGMKCHCIKILENKAALAPWPWLALQDHLCLIIRVPLSTLCWRSSSHDMGQDVVYYKNESDSFSASKIIVRGCTKLTVRLSKEMVLFNKSNLLYYEIPVNFKVSLFYKKCHLLRKLKQIVWIHAKLFFQNL